jgi:hypothetical protein
MLSYVFMALSALGSILLVFGTQIHWLWLLPIGIGIVNKGLTLSNNSLP